MSEAYNLELEAFRQQVRQFVRNKLPKDLRTRQRTERFSLEAADQKLFLNLLYEQGGWTCPGWPAEWGGPGWSYPQQFLFERELSLGYAPRLNLAGCNMIGPALMEFGTEQQKQQHLPGILKGEVLWCQGYSEPNAGSDLAALKCRAQRVGDEYVINGSKMWTSDAHECDWIFGLFRTDSTGKKQHGITVLVLDMRTPGVEIRPIIKFDGLHELNETVFNDVRVPVANRVGDEHDGWTIAKYILGYERFGTAEVSRSEAMLTRLKSIAAREHSDGHTLLEEPAFSDAIAHTEIELRSLEATEQRYLFGPQGPDAMGPEASLLKVRGTEIQQYIAELTFNALAYYGVPNVPEQLDPGFNQGIVGSWETGYAARSYFALRAASIYSGSNEIQKNIISKAVLGL